jgi:hypothetical protein
MTKVIGKDLVKAPRPHFRNAEAEDSNPFTSTGLEALVRGVFSALRILAGVRLMDTRVGACLA